MTKTSGLERVPSGIDGLDTILGGGLFRAGAYIVQAPARPSSATRLPTTMPAMAGGSST